MKMTCKSNERCIFSGTICQQLLFWPGSSVDKRNLLPLRSRKSAFQVLLCLKSGGQGKAWLPHSAERIRHAVISYKLRKAVQALNSVFTPLTCADLWRGIIIEETLAYIKLLIKNNSTFQLVQRKVCVSQSLGGKIKTCLVQELLTHPQTSASYSTWSCTAMQSRQQAGNNMQKWVSLSYVINFWSYL